MDSQKVIDIIIFYCQTNYKQGQTLECLQLQH